MVFYFTRMKRPTAAVGAQLAHIHLNVYITFVPFFYRYFCIIKSALHVFVEAISLVNNVGPFKQHPGIHIMHVFFYTCIAL